jgi:hypothetical protein
MNPTSVSKSLRPGWKDLYIAALFETDKNRLFEKIAEAQTAIVAPRRELYMSGQDVSESGAQERRVLDTALLSLQALANCLAIKPPVGARPAVGVPNLTRQNVSVA